MKIPAGIDNGARLRMSREGEAGERGAPPGDLESRRLGQPPMEGDGGCLLRFLGCGLVWGADGSTWAAIVKKHFAGAEWGTERREEESQSDFPSESPAPPSRSVRVEISHLG